MSTAPGRSLAHGGLRDGLWLDGRGAESSAPGSAPPTAGAPRGRVARVAEDVMRAVMRLVGRLGPRASVTAGVVGAGVHELPHCLSVAGWPQGAVSQTPLGTRL